MKVLIVEDELLIQQSLKKLLQKKGAEVDTHSSGKQAIESILNENYDRIICDLMLQDISGFNVIEEAKKKYDKAEISKKFIIITAYSSEQIMEKAKKYQCKILSKPFSNLQTAIEIFISQ